MREHEFREGWCLHCGAKHHPQMTATCLERRAALATEPRRRVSALDDSDAISARLGELRAEKEAALNTPAENGDLPAAGKDWCCG